MKAFRLLVCALCVVLPLAGCSQNDSPESISKEIGSHMKEMAQILDGIKDEASAKEAVPKIQAVRAKMRDVSQRAKKVKVDAESEQKVNEAMMKEMEDVMKTLGPANVKLVLLMESNAAVRAIIEPALKGMEDDM